MSDYDALFLDAFGTLITVDDPGRRLQAGVAEVLGTTVDLDTAERAFAAEVAHYAANCHRGVDESSLAQLYRECAAIATAELGIELDAAQAVELLGDTIRYVAYPDSEGLIAAAHSGGLTVAVVSNADYTLPAMLAEAGLEVDLAFSSAQTRSSKPDPQIFRHALAAAGTTPERTLMVGDTPDADAEGARAVGMPARIVDRDGIYPDRDDTVGSLTQIAELIR